MIEYLLNLGRITILRTYGNFTGGSAAEWNKLVRKHGMVARHMPSIATGKNAADIALTIDAIEMLLTRDIDTFVLVAGDSDFTPLAHRLREQGKDLIGFGSRCASVSFRSACTVFYDIRTLSPWADQPATATVFWKRLPSDAEALVITALTDLGWIDQPVALQTLGEYLAQRLPGFDTRTYSRRTLSDLLRDLPSVELIEVDGHRHARPANGEIRTG